MWAARAAASLTWQASSVYVRWRPPPSVVIVIHLVTRQLAALLQQLSHDVCGRSCERLCAPVAEAEGRWLHPVTDHNYCNQLNWANVLAFKLVGVAGTVARSL